MKNRFYILVCIFFTSLFLYSCQSAKDVIQGKTRSESSDEFLVQKKNPLSMPPDFNKLPVPVSEKQNPSTCDHSKRLATRTDRRVHRRENEAHAYLESFQRKYCPATALSLTGPNYGADITPISPSVQPANSRHRGFLTTRTDGSIF